MDTESLGGYWSGVTGREREGSRPRKDCCARRSGVPRISWRVYNQLTDDPSGGGNDEVATVSEHTIDVRVHQDIPQEISCRRDVRSARCCAQWVLRLAAEARVRPSKGGCAPSSPNPYVVQSKSWHLRRTTGLSGLARSWRDVQQAPGRASHAREQDRGSARLSNTAYFGRQAVGPGTESRQSEFRCQQTEPDLGLRHHLSPDMGRLAVLGRGHGSVFSQDYCLGYSLDDRPAARARRHVDGCPQQAAPRNDHSFRPRVPIWERRLAMFLPR